MVVGKKLFIQLLKKIGYETWCCSESINKCPAKKERSRINQIGKNHDLAKPIETTKLCSFGCGQIAKYVYKNGSFCCQDDWHRCHGEQYRSKQYNDYTNNKEHEQERIDHFEKMVIKL